MSVAFWMKTKIINMGWSLPDSCYHAFLAVSCPSLLSWSYLFWISGSISASGLCLCYSICIKCSFVSSSPPPNLKLIAVFWGRPSLNSLASQSHTYTHTGTMYLSFVVPITFVISHLFPWFFHSGMTPLLNYNCHETKDCVCFGILIFPVLIIVSMFNKYLLNQWIMNKKYSSMILFYTHA